MNTTIADSPDTPIPFARPCLGPEEEAAVLRVLRSGWLTTAGECAAFEKEFAQAAGVPHALAVNSATSGLHLALEALGIGPGDAVAVSPYTFTASCEVMRYLGADPAFVDIAPGTFHMDPDQLEKTLQADRASGKPRIKAIMAVHIGGLGLFSGEYRRLARDWKLPLVEDAAHAAPAREQDGTWLGTGGTIGVFSFYANKTITTGEGGMVVCHDPALAARMKVMRSHGIDRDVWARFTTKASQWRYSVVEAGYKYNMPDLAAALGRVQLSRADEFLEARRLQALAYHQAFRDLPWLRLPPGNPADTGREHSWHLYTLGIGQPGDGLREAFLDWLDRKGTGTSVHYIPLHMMPYYKERYSLEDEDFPVSKATFSTAASLPLYPGLTQASLDRIIQAVRDFPGAAGHVPTGSGL